VLERSGADVPADDRRVDEPVSDDVADFLGRGDNFGRERDGDGGGAGDGCGSDLHR
jgi:hypothetical protein